MNQSPLERLLELEFKLAYNVAKSPNAEVGLTSEEKSEWSNLKQQIEREHEYWNCREGHAKAVHEARTNQRTEQDKQNEQIVQRVKKLHSMSGGRYLLWGVTRYLLGLDDENEFKSTLSEMK